MELAGKSLGKYQIKALIGSGGAGSVHRALHPGLQVEVAVKVLSPELTLNPEGLARFRREATTMARLRHPGVVPIQDTDVSEGFHFLVMPLITDPTLKADLAEREANGPYPVERAVQITYCLLEALQAVHAENVIHRDLKPANIFVTTEGRAMIADFGLARDIQFSELSQTGTMVGTFLWMSPEQLNNKPLDERSDLYQVGLILYRMLAGALPYGDDVPGSFAAKLQQAQFPPPSRELPEPLVKFCLSLCARDPEARPASAAAALAQLAGPQLPMRRALTLPPTDATKISGTGPIRALPAPATPARSRWGLFAGVALVLALVVLRVAHQPRVVPVLAGFLAELSRGYPNRPLSLVEKPWLTFLAAAALPPLEGAPLVREALQSLGKVETPSTLGLLKDRALINDAIYDALTNPKASDAVLDAAGAQLLVMDREAQATLRALRQRDRLEPRPGVPEPARPVFAVLALLYPNIVTVDGWKLGSHPPLKDAGRELNWFRQHGLGFRQTVGVHILKQLLTRQFDRGP